MQKIAGFQPVSVLKQYFFHIDSSNCVSEKTFFSMDSCSLSRLIKAHRMRWTFLGKGQHVLCLSSDLYVMWSC
ncbi:hypothetical protein DPEC_G00272310 [Dallia pectoralis]|uniref:Uncharacterized protein n=1 Tax=Dallia pectoralis TaxID=75939 RepID=A0ACC2FPX2_DALPE|nr:hypothetical protein DPEC_G00272310 [Dallia pectoralis]